MPTIGDGKKEKGGDMMAKKTNCGCGCVPPGKKIKTKNESKPPKSPKKPAK
jgi:hypothetical protein